MSEETHLAALSLVQFRLGCTALLPGATGLVGDIKMLLDEIKRLKEPPMLDVNRKNVEIEISAEGVLWVNTDGKCELRAQECVTLAVNDQRQTKCGESVDNDKH